MTGKPAANRQKRAVNVSISKELIEEAREFGTNVSAVLERALDEEHREKRRERWRRENQSAIRAWNNWVDENGVPFEDLRAW
jgi:antitoxin CcdA